MNIKHRDLVQNSWYHYALKGFTEIQITKYNSKARHYKQAALATPVWQDIDEILDMFLYARLMREQGIDMHTDHIVPIMHPYVCGLHCRANLQHITSCENIRKGNRYWPDMWECQCELQLQMQ